MQSRAPSVTTTSVSTALRGFASQFNNETFSDRVLILSRQYRQKRSSKQQLHSHSRSGRAPANSRGCLNTRASITPAKPTELVDIRAATVQHLKATAQSSGATTVRANQLSDAHPNPISAERGTTFSAASITATVQPPGPREGIDASLHLTPLRSSQTIRRGSRAKAPRSLVKEDTVFGLLYVHAVILAGQSEVFQRMLVGSMSESKQKEISIEMGTRAARLRRHNPLRVFDFGAIRLKMIFACQMSSQEEADAFTAMVRSVYTGIVDDTCKPTQLFQMLQLADKFECACERL
jgi:hypothetical protein